MGSFCLDGYDEANLLLAWSYDRVAEQAVLAFARLELLPAEIPASASGLFVSGTGQPHVWVGLERMTAADGLAWYEAALDGAWSVPPELASLLPPPPKNGFAPLAEGLQEPTWPTVSTLQVIPPAMPFVPRDLGGRIHSRLVDASAQPALILDELPSVSDAMEPGLHFALAKHPKLVGSVHLIAGSPVLRSASVSLATVGEDENLLVTLIPRRGQTTKGLTVTVWERRGAGTCLLHRQTDPPLTQTVALRGKRGEVGMSIDSDKYGRIRDQKPYPFLREIRTRMAIQGAPRKVTVERNGKPETYGASSYSTEESIVGTPAAKSALSILRAANDRLRAHDNAARDQLWFEKDGHAARDKLRELVGRANREVLLVDYFMTGSDLWLLVPAVGDREVEIKILTSREGLKKAKGKLKDVIADMLKQRDDIAHKAQMQRAKIRVLGGQQSPVHDRFLIVDERIYLMGSSLNNYGQRGTMLVALPYPEVVRSEILRHWNNASDLEDVR